MTPFWGTNCTFVFGLWMIFLVFCVVHLDIFFSFPFILRLAFLDLPQVAKSPCAHRQAVQKLGKIKHTPDLSKGRRYLALFLERWGKIWFTAGNPFLPVEISSVHITQ